jgi:hypothetical protein
MAMFICYIFLMVFVWTFIGEKVWVGIPFTSSGFHILIPFTSLKWVILFYGVIGFFSFIFWCVGAGLVSLGVFCVTTAPLLYNFALFLVVTYWIGFFIVCVYLINFKWGEELKNAVLYSTATPSLQEAQEKIFRREFKKYDFSNNGRISKDDLIPFFVNVGVFVSEEEFPKVVDELEPNDDGEINIHVLLGWYKEYNAKTDGYAADANNMDDDSDNDDKKSKSKKDTTKVTKFDSTKKDGDDESDEDK